MNDFFTLLFSDYHTLREKRLGARLSQTAGLVAQAQEVAASQAETIAMLTERTAYLELQTMRLGAIVSAMGELLIERGVLDPTRSAELVAAALARLEPPPQEAAPAPPAARGGSPYRGVTANPEPRAPQTITCAGCKATIAIETSNVTENGPLCDPCFQTGQVELMEKEAAT